MNTVTTVTSEQSNEPLTGADRPDAITVNCLGVTIGAHVILTDGIPGNITKLYDGGFAEFTPDNYTIGFPIAMNDIQAVR